MSHQPLDPRQGLRRLHAPPLLPNGRGKKAAPPPILGDAPLKLHLPNRHSPRRKQFTAEELTVTHLRQIYSSLLEELAPLHHEIGTGGNDAHYRWKNAGTVTVNGSEDEGYDYSYTPDNSQKSWRLQRGAPGGAGGGGGITGGDWAKDGIRRYYTGGALERGGGGHSSNIISVGGMDVDVGTMDGVALSPRRGARKGEYVDGEEVPFDPPALDHNFSIDDDGDADGNDEGESLDIDANALADALEDEFQDVDIANSGHPPVDAFRSTSDDEQTPNAESDNANNNMTAFESMYHLSPTMAWRLRSAYAPTTPHEQHLNALGSELLAQRHPGQADGIMKGLAVARNCESRVCDGLRKLGELVSYCERLKGVQYASQGGRLHRRAEGEVEEASSDEEEEDLEAAEAIFAYFCEKNVLPMLIDALLCHPPPLTSSPTDGDATDNMLLPTNTTTIGSSPTPFSGVAWTSAVKAQILQTIAMILFNTSSPLSLTYLLSNNYMNELIMGIQPLDQWKADALEDILPPYITLLRGIVMRLRSEEGSCCLPLFLCQRQRPGSKASGDEDPESTETYLPLLYAAMQVFCSPFGASLKDSEGCLIRTTAMNVILNLCRISDAEIRAVLVGGGDALKASLPTTKSAPAVAPSPSLLSHPLTIEQELMFPHICKSLNSWFHRSVRLALVSLSMDNKKHRDEDAKAEAKARHRDMAETQFRELQYWLGFLDDLLSCEIRAWNIRLVEWLLREVVVGTVLLRWNRSLETIGPRSNDDGTKVSSEVLKARAEARVSLIFLTQLFGMVEYSPLIRLVGTLVLHQNYPGPWLRLKNETDFDNEDGLFAITSTINAMIRKQTSTGEEADAGAGGGPPNAMLGATESVQEQTGGRRTSLASSNDSEGRAVEPLAARLDFHQLADEVGHQNSDGKHFAQNRHRAALLAMIAGNAQSDEETLLASMLMATILENDAIDDAALEVFGVLPSPTITDERALSPFENSIAQCLSGVDGSDTQSYATLECASSLGLMLLERLIGHTWSEGGQCVDAVSFEMKMSKLVQALGACLTQFASLAESHLAETNVIHEIFSELVRQRYTSPDDVDPSSPRSQESVKAFSSLQNYYPSNFIDNAAVLVEITYGDASCNEPSSAGDDLFLVNEESEAARFAIRAVLHLRSIVGCIQDLYQRVTDGPDSTIDSHWHGEEDLLSFRTTEEADDILLAIGGVQTTQLPELGTDIDLRGRKSFRCNLPRKPKFGRNIEYDIVIDANGTRFVVTEKAELVLVVDPAEMYVTKLKKRDPNRCTVLSVVPHRSIVASGAEGELLRIVTSAEEIPPGTDEFIKNGTLSLRFQSSKACQSAKECLDKHCSANENKNLRDMSELLEQCKWLGASVSRAAPQDGETEADNWCDFQG
ncbi:hypothetical protein ACHAXT_005571 [Thalassiosira profunda]